ncbi:MAG: hypothetical protein IKU30_03400 [Clostridia bacterium]|nr:hypothetical protein [Clostridia bacterium]
MKMSEKKIDAMHRLFGRKAGYKCGECKNLLHIQANNKLVSKCAIYGDTRSEASDWVQKWTACGKLNQPYKGRPVIKITEEWRRKAERNKPDEPLEGQLTWDDIDENERDIFEEAI